MERIETTILRNLIFNDEYSKKVLPFLHSEYFENVHEKIIFEEATKFIVKYNNLPTREAISIEAEKRTDITDEIFKQVEEQIGVLEDYPADNQWLLDTTEKWCRDRAKN